MDRWRFVLLLSMFSCLKSEVMIEKTIRREPDTTHKDSEVINVAIVGEEPDLTPICSSDALNIILFVDCKIRTNQGEECGLLYNIGHDFVQECASNFRLKKESQSVFLSLRSLTVEDSGSIVCECSRTDGMYILHLNVTAEVQAHISSQKVLPWVLVIIIIIAGVALGYLLRKKYCRVNTESGAAGQHGAETHPPLNCDDSYESLRQPTHDIYKTISRVHFQHVTKSNNTVTKSGWEIYENFSN
ncbi:uncharacterized protein LOC121506407 [Cheilinus undulatus]|uniref:uncharacterized protein LOC121506407 n=1 Tax=Cheilinus undulatus TaxID=241271 RepID=UPI001BD354FE|nr:uncharacterized protein LOC121506407 [Cheilinus undulatus]XP_041638133.1 uncharacterized protein LOC121506407 [Cheilinus undulatus]